MKGEGTSDAIFSERELTLSPVRLSLALTWPWMCLALALALPWAVLKVLGVELSGLGLVFSGFGLSLMTCGLIDITDSGFHG